MNTMHLIEQIGSLAPFVYDAAILYALVVNKMIADNVDYKSGSQFFKYAQKIQFNGECY